MSERALTSGVTKRTIRVTLTRVEDISSTGSSPNEGEHMAIADIKLETPSATLGGGEEGGCCGGACCGGK